MQHTVRMRDMKTDKKIRKMRIRHVARLVSLSWNLNQAQLVHTFFFALIEKLISSLTAQHCPLFYPSLPPASTNAIINELALLSSFAINRLLPH